MHVVDVEVLLDHLGDVVSWTVLERREHVMLPLVLTDLLERFLDLDVVEIKLLLNLDMHAPLPIELERDLILRLRPVTMTLRTLVLLLEHLRDHDVLSNQRVSTHPPSEHQAVDDEPQLLSSPLDRVVVHRCQGRPPQPAPPLLV